MNLWLYWKVVSDHHARDGSSPSSGYGRWPSMYKGYEKYWLGLLGSMAMVFLFYELLARMQIIKNIPLFV